MFDRIRLNHADLAHTKHRRERAVRPDKRVEGGDAAYDFTTLWYDAIQKGRRITLVCPRLVNLVRLVRKARWQVDGQEVRTPRIRNYYRHSILTLDAPEGAEMIAAGGADWQVETGIAQAGPTRFDGLNCEMLISRDNRLEWIAEKLGNHVRHHGLEAVLFLDNGSTAYGPEAIIEVLRDTGLKAGLVVELPYPWGPTNKPGAMHRELFLQTAAYNVARLRFLAGARAVLRMDIDETLCPPKGAGTETNVFDAATRSALGYVQFNGLTRYPAPGSEPPFQFADHVWRGHEDRPGGGNWCVVPQGRLRRFQWRCHNLEGFPLTFLSRRKGAWYYDCQGITTGWKHPDRWAPDKPLIRDDDTETFFRNAGFEKGR